MELNGERTPEQKRFAELEEALWAAYDVLAAQLSRLPIWIALNDDEWDADDALPAMDRAVTVIPDLPAHPAVKMLLPAAIVDWMAGYEIGVTIMTLGLSQWRLRIMEAAIARIAAARDLIERHLD